MARSSGSSHVGIDGRQYGPWLFPGTEYRRRFVHRVDPSSKSRIQSDRFRRARL